MKKITVRLASLPTVNRVGYNGADGVVWDDLRFPASAVRVGSAAPATEQTYKGGIVLKFANGADNYIYFVAQLPHGYKLETDLSFHIHIVLPSAGAGGGAENIKFDLTYSWAAINGSFPAETTITATRDVQNDSADTHIYFDIGTVLESNMNGTAGVSEILICSLKRDTAVANNYADNVYFLEADFHFQKDTIGSLQEASKS